jgi:hypothetical protein
MGKLKVNSMGMCSENRSVRNLDFLMGLLLMVNEKETKKVKSKG